MSKYIIDTETWANLFEVQRVGVYGIGNDIVTDEKTIWSRMFSLDELEELNSDYINEHYGELQDEAYQRGINDGSLDVKQRVEGAYQRGLNDAWRLAEDVVYNRGNVLDILRCVTVGAAFDKYSGEQALDILRTYENKQKDRIEVGDEVEDSGGDKTIVTNIHGNLFDGLCSDGSVMSDLFLDDNHKTGKHYDIASILEAMRNDR